MAKRRKLKLTIIFTTGMFLHACILNAQLNNSQQTIYEIEQSLPHSPAEKLFIHTAKTFYLPGEIIWFKIYVTDALLHHPLSVSKVAYAELLDSANKPVLQAKIAIDSGTGNGSLALPSYITTGNYILRAYTNIIKNDGPVFYFYQPITIINPAKTNEPLITELPASYYASFFPEGGQLVSGLQNTVAFKINDLRGYGVDAGGIIINQRNDTIVRFTPHKFGMGRFRFTPIDGNTYKAIINYPNEKSIVYNLPEVIQKGYTLQVTELSAAQLSVEVQTNADPLWQAVYLVIHARQSVFAAMANETKEGRTSFLINKTDLPDGVTHFTLFNRYKEAVAERLYFKQPTNELQISINTDGASYNSRTKINTTIATTQNGKPVVADLSMAVVLLDSLQTISSNNIRSYLWLGSELRGFIESPDYYFTSAGPEVIAAADNLMLTQGWRKLLSANAGTQSTLYIPEYSGHIITGKVTDKRTGAPAKGIITYLSVPGDRFHFSSCRSDENGRIHFDCKKIVGTENIIVQTNKEIDSSYRIEIDNPFSENYIKTDAGPLVVSEKWQNQLLTRITATQVQNAFTNTQTQQFYLPNFSDTTPFFGKPDKTYLLDEYTRFYTMEEVMREYVTEVQVRKNQKDFRYRMLNLPYKLFFEDNPLVLIDGVPVFDINKIIAFDPLKVKKLDIVSRKYFQGAVSYDGIASYSTYQGDLGGYQLDPSAIILEYAGLQLQRQFYSPQYETTEDKKSRIPDFRNLLYWSPDIKTGKGGTEQVNFFSSDLPGNYAIVVQGITSTGGAGSKIIAISVTR